MHNRGPRNRRGSSASAPPRTRLRVRVSTGGCTTANDFNVNVERYGSQANVTLVRVTPDNCKGNFPEGVEIAISYQAAGIERPEQVQLMNRVSPQR